MWWIIILRLHGLVNWCGGWRTWWHDIEDDDNEVLSQLKLNRLVLRSCRKRLRELSVSNWNSKKTIISHLINRSHYWLEELQPLRFLFFLHSRIKAFINAIPVLLKVIIGVFFSRICWFRKRVWKIRLERLWRKWNIIVIT